MLNKLKPLYCAARDFIADFECAEKHDGAGDYSESRSKSDTINSADRLVDAVVAYGKQSGAVHDCAPATPGQTDTLSERPAIPHADLIRAVLDGKVVQAGYCEDVGPNAPIVWEDCTPQEAIAEMVTNPDTIFRLKPNPIVRWVPMWNHNAIGDGEQYDTKEELREAMFAGGWVPIKAYLRLELDPDTLEVINARTEAP